MTNKAKLRKILRVFKNKSSFFNDTRFLPDKSKIIREIDFFRHQKMNIYLQPKNSTMSIVSPKLPHFSIQLFRFWYDFQNPVCKFQ